MTPQQFKDSLKELGWNQAEFARKTGMTPVTVSRWARGDYPRIPGWVDAYLTLAKEVKATARLLERKSGG